MMKLNPYLSFDGKCSEAFKFYEHCLNGKIVEMMSYGSSPMAEQTPPEMQDKIMHVNLVVDNMELMGGDAMPGNYQIPQGMSVTLYFEDFTEANRVFTALAENGQVQMPLQETFWAKGFGMLVDQFGTPWMINCANPA